MRQRWAVASDHALRAFLRLVPTEQQRLFALTLVIGAVCGLVAVAFHGMIRLVEQLFIDRAMAMPGRSWIGWTLAVPTLGALVAGLLLHYALPDARGSGIPQVKFIYAVTRWRSCWRVGLRPVPIYEALLDQDGMHLPDTQRTATALSALSVGDAMTTDVTVLSADLRVAQAIEQIKGLPYTMYPVAGADGRVLGIVTESRLRRQLASEQGDAPVGEHARTEEYLRAGTPLVDAVVRMNQLGARQMAVVDQDQGARVVGVLAMSDVMRAHASAASEPADSLPGPGPAPGRPPVSWARRDSGLAHGSHRPPPADDREGGP